MDFEDMFWFAGKCLGAALIFKGVDEVFEARKRRHAERVLIDMENQRREQLDRALTDMENKSREQIDELKREIARLKGIP